MTKSNITYTFIIFQSIISMSEYDLMVQETNDALTIAEKCTEIFTSVGITKEFSAL